MKTLPQTAWPKALLTGALCLALLGCQTTTGPNTSDPPSETQSSEHTQMASILVQVMADYHQNDEFFAGGQMTAQQSGSFNTQVFNDTLEDLGKVETNTQISVDASTQLLDEVKVNVELELNSRQNTLLQEVAEFETQLNSRSKSHNDVLAQINLGGNWELNGSETVEANQGKTRIQALTYTHLATQQKHDVYVSHSSAADNNSIDIYVKAKGSSESKEAMRSIKLDSRGKIKTAATRSKRQWKNGYRSEIYEEHQFDSQLKGSGRLTLFTPQGAQEEYILSSTTDANQKTTLTAKKVSQSENYAVTLKEQAQGKCQIVVNEDSAKVESQYELSSTAKLQ